MFANTDAATTLNVNATTRLVFALAICLAIPSVTTGQDNHRSLGPERSILQGKRDSSGEVPVDTESGTTELTPNAEQKKVVLEVYNATKTAKSATQLTEVIQRCDAAATLGLSEKRLAYLRSLKAWALTRRGESRLEVAQQLKSIGNIVQYQSAFDESIEDFNDSLSIDTSGHRTFNSRGLAYLSDNQFLLAAKDFGKAVGIKADYAAGYFNRAEALSRLQKLELAIEDYDTVLSLSPGDAQALTGRAHARLELGQFASALEDYDRVIDQHPNNGTALINRGDCLQASDDWQQALDDYAAAKALGLQDTADQRTAWLLATSESQAFRKPKQALQLIEACLERASSPTIAMLETVAAAQAAAGQFEEARKNQSKAIKLIGATETANSNQAASPTALSARLALYQQDKPFVQRDSNEESVDE